MYRVLIGDDDETILKGIRFHLQEQEALEIVTAETKEMLAGFYLVDARDLFPDMVIPNGVAVVVAGMIPFFGILQRFGDEAARMTAPRLETRGLALGYDGVTFATGIDLTLNCLLTPCVRKAPQLVRINLTKGTNHSEVTVAIDNNCEDFVQYEPKRCKAQFLDCRALPPQTRRSALPRRTR